MTRLNFNECSICFDPVEDSPNTPKPINRFTLLCKKCDDALSPEEIGVITHAFNVARGIFNTVEKGIIAVKDVLYDVQSEIKLQMDRNITINSIFQKILIRSQVYGLSLNYFYHINSQYSENMSNNSKCSICNRITIKDSEHKDNIAKNEGVCQDCNQKYSKEEIMIMTSLFKKYGGFFNQFNNQKPTLGKIIENFLKSLKKEYDLSRMLEFNERALYKSLLYGYTPKAFIEELKKF